MKLPESIIVELRLSTGRTLFRRNNNPLLDPKYNIWIDADGYEWNVNFKRMYAMKTSKRFKELVE